jgi:hypothetical protein
MTVGGSLSPAAASPQAGAGYWMLSHDGNVYPFGQAPDCGDPLQKDDFPMAATWDIEPMPDNSGYWFIGHFYGTFAVGQRICTDWPNPKYLMSGEATLNLLPNEMPVSLSATPDGSGLWVFTDRGRVLPFGAAQWFGDMSGVALNDRVLDSVVTPSGKGYYMVAADGGIFTFGDAKFAGSMGGKPLNAQVVSMAPDPDGRGYWLLGWDGGIFTFDAPYYGSMGAVRLNAPTNGILASPTGRGYLMVAEDGGVFTFGDVPFYGSLGANPPDNMIAAIAVMR